ncbi:MAG: amino acid adenylation domain-containing protein [Bacteroidota bacterium]
MKTNTKVLHILDQAIDNGLSVFLDGEDLKVKIEKDRQVNQEVINLLKIHKKEIQQFLLQEVVNGSEKQAAIPSYDRSTVDHLPLSIAQERLWFIDKLEGSTHYHIPGVLRLKGQLNVEALETTFREIVNRHEVLRTTFREEAGTVYQHILGKNQWSLNRLQPKTALHNGQLEKLISERLNTPFDLANDHLIRVDLLHLAQEEHLLIVTMHHIASDGWSIALLIEELIELYEAIKEEKVSVLNKLPIQYTDFALWQRQYLEGPAYKQSMDYWEQQLANIAPLSLPLDFPRPNIQSRKGDLLHFSIKAQMQDQLHALAKAQGTTLYMLLLTAFKVLLFRYSGESDICVGSPIANRTHPEIEPLIGYFTNMLALRSDLSGNPQFTDLLQVVKTNTLDAYAHQEVPFEKIVDRVVEDRDRSRSPLFQVAFVLQNTPSHAAFRLNGMSMSRESTPYKSAKFDLTFTLTETENGIDLLVEYCSDLFESTTIENMQRHYQNLLQNILQFPERSIGDLEMLDKKEKEELLYSADLAQVSYPKDLNIVNLFEAQAKKYPKRIALAFEDQVLNYQSLDQKANQLAHHLRSQGLAPKSLVGICLDRSLDMVIGLLAIIKCGAAYVPIDPAYPQQRIDYILEDAQINFLITEQQWTHKVKAQSDLQVILLDQEKEQIEAQPTNSVSVKVSPNDLIYIIYTSGTTGKPKGVMLEHRNIVRLFFNDQAHFDFRPDDVWTLFHSFCFDFSVWEMYGALLFGGKLIILPKALTKDPAQLCAQLHDSGVTVLNQTPNAFYNLQEFYLQNYTSTSIRYVIFGGEALAPEKLNNWKTSFPNCQLINMYGITETTVHVTYKAIESVDIKAGYSNIGQAIPTLQCYLLDDSLNPVPKGVSGEIYVSGAGLARGYLHRPALTAERFIDNPFAKGEHGKLYKTGDLARWLPNGDMAYLGRKDDQVKIRGHRIELGEVTSALEACQGVKQGIVMAKADKKGNKRLVAYLVLEMERSTNKVEQELREQLPEYMLPQVFIPLENIPLTANGKINKKALPAPNTFQTSGQPYVAPRTELEQQIAAIWSAVLEVERIGVMDDFFKIGGDSITIIRVISQLKSQLGKSIAVADFYRASSIAQLAKLLQEKTNEGDTEQNKYREVAQSLTQLKEEILAQFPRADEIEEIYPMSDIQKGMVFASLIDQDRAIYHDQFLAALPCPDIELCQEVFTLLCDKHPALRTAFNLEDYAEEIQLIYSAVPVHIDVLDLRGQGEEEQKEAIRQYMKEERKRPFDFDEAPLWRATIFKTSADHIAFLFQFHHAILDGWSVASLHTEFVQIYLALQQDAQYRPEPLRSTYREAIIESRLEKQNTQVLNFWKTELDDYKRLSLFTEEVITQNRIQSYDSKLVKQLQNLAQQEQIPLKNLFLGAYFATLNLLNYESDLTIGMITNNRPICEDGDKILGCFLNSIPVRLQCQEAATAQWPTFFKQLNEKLDLLQQHNRLTLYEMSKQCGESTNKGNPFFDVIFNYIDFHIYDELKSSPIDTKDYQDIKLESYEKTNTFLDLTVDWTEAILQLKFTQSRALKSGISLDDFCTYYQHILQSIAEGYDATSTAASLLPQPVEQMLLKQYNATAQAYDKQKNPLVRFEAQAQQSPNQIALLTNEESLSYQSLNQRANQLAHYLTKKGVGPDTLVIMCMDRTADMIVGLLGILKAGATYVPVDPNYPTDRIQYIIKDAAARFVISNKSNQHLLDQQADIEVILMDSHWEAISKEASDNPGIKRAEEGLFYVIYTSGSTGKPKGVMISNQNTAVFVDWCEREFGERPFDIVYGVTSICFDLSLFEIFYTLGTGKQLRLLESGMYIADYLNHDQNILINTVPTVIATLLEEEVDWTNVNIINMAGEPIPLSTQEALDVERIEVRNCYGPSEDTTYSTYYQLQTGKPLLIGRPVSNTQAFVLDADLQLLAPGAIGELCLSGDGVAKGYLNRKTLTREKFIDHPYPQYGGAKLYRTGDLARWLPDGTLDFLGRKDAQVKVRGYRIELGEIEAVLEQLDQIQQVVVLVKEDTKGDKMLVAYVVAEGDFETVEMQAYLRSRLPDYMVPSIMISLAAMPQTPNGKIDKLALPHPNFSQVNRLEFIAPRDDLEQSIAQIWADLLKVERIGLLDNFFERGGHSLLATRAASNIRKALEVEIAIKDIFTYPTIEKLSQFLRHKEKGFSLPPVRAVKDKPKRIPLSYAQERLRFLEQLNQRSIYHIPYVQSFSKELNVEHLWYALNSIVNRHESLRTVIREEAGEAYQQVLPMDNWVMEIVAGSKEDLPHLVQNALEQPFDLSKDYMLRTQLIQLEDAYVLVLVMHHIAADGWSIGILLQEIMALYRSQSQGQSLHLSELAIQYTDYALWQREHLNDQLLNEKLDYWKAHLQGLSPLNLPLDFPRPKLQSTKGRSISFELDEELTKALHQISRAQGVTMYMLLLTVFKVLLYKYSGQSDICVGSPVANRGQKELEGLIGFFVNSVALRSDLSGNPAFDQVLQQIKAISLEAYKYQDTPFEQVVEQVIEQRDPSRSPLFQVLFSLQNLSDDINLAQKTGLLLPELALAAEQDQTLGLLDAELSKYDLTLAIIESDGRLIANIEFCTALFKESSMRRLQNHYTELIKAIIKEPLQRIDQLSLVSQEEQEKLLVDFNDTDYDYPNTKSLLQLFDEQVKQHPNKLAVHAADVQLSYRELEERSNQLANYLQAHQVKAGDTVGVLLDRGVDMITSIWGILKCGAIYVPLNKDYPPSRLAYIAADANLAGIIYQDQDLLEASGLLEWKALSLEAIEQYPIHTAVHPSIAATPAYIMYTSGTTGQPKGILVSHQNIVKLVVEPGPIQVFEEDRVLQWSNFAFDGSTYEIYSALLKGASLYMITEETAYDPGLLAQVIQSHDVSVAFITTALFNAFVDYDLSSYQSLRILLFGGEMVSVNHVQRALLADGPQQIIHVYGPTETTVYASYYPIKEAGPVVPIGYPLSNTQIYILTPDQQLAGIGIEGELYIGGDGVALGYLNREELTRERFIPSPFPGSDRLYRTGDIARWRSDGTVEFVGRKDDQVKIRGYRIELGEVEAVLNACKGVKQQVVVVRKDEQDNKQMVAYIVPDGPFNTFAIQSQMKEQLPDYMVPALMVAMDQLPLNKNGKVDKKALPAPKTSHAPTNDYVAPSKPLEKSVAHIWSNLLGIERIGIHDNFFELGGHSILAIKLMSSLRHDLNIEVAMKDLFAYPTIATLCTAFDTELRTTPIPPINIDAERPKQVPLSFAQERLWFLDQLSGSTHYHIPYVQGFQSDLDVASLQEAFSELINRHEALRTVIIEEEGRAYQQVLSKNQWHLPLVDTEATMLETTIKDFINQPFDLTKDHMLRAKLYRLPDANYVLTLVMHHIASDGWSTGLLIREVTELYQAKQKGEKANLSDLSIQYTDYAWWQSQYLDEQRMEQKLDFWERQLRGYQPLSLATDHPRPRRQSNRGQRFEFDLDSNLTLAIKDLCKEEGVTLFMVLLSAFKVLLYRYSGQTDVCVGSPVANRGPKEAEDLIGFFVNTIALRSQMSGNPSFSNLLAQVKKTTLDCFKHQDTPFEKIVERMVEERDPSRSPIFQVMFSLQNVAEELQQNQASNLLLPDLARPMEELTEALSKANQQSKFDLTFAITELTDSLRVSVEFCTDLFERATMERLAGHYQSVVREAVNDPVQGIDQLEFLSASERETLVQGFNDYTLARREEYSPIDLFIQEAQRNPQQIALRHQQQSLSYEALDQRSNQLAHYLQEKGIKKGDWVGICLNRSLDLVIAILGIVKAGGAYVPIDPNYPAKRMAFMLEDAKAAFVISHSKYQHLLTAQEEIAIWVDREEAAIASCSQEALAIDYALDDLNYVIYTSGSTGQPKGVMIEAKALMNLVRWHQDAYQVSEASRATILAGVGFDASVWEIWPYLSAGAQLCIIDDTERIDPALLVQRFEAYEISHSFIPTALASDFVEQTRGKKLPLAYLLTGGDRLSPMDIQGLDYRLFNNYGPTENAVVSTFYEVQANDKDRVPPIGRPIANVAIYILDSREQLSPIGVPGELCIGGASLAKGYWNRPLLNEEKFISHPYQKTERIYRTGDMARWLADGSIEFIGRKDDQVKIRGFRIELGEIERVLDRCELVHQNRVFAQKSPKGDTVLVAYIIAEGTFDQEATKTFAQKQLPDYMVPPFMVAIDQFPLNPNGKVDRKALPQPDFQALLQRQYIAPRNDVEQSIAAIWSDLLQVEQVGIEDNFFDLGGHSLLATRAVSAIRRNLQVDIAVNDLFNAPSIKALSAVLEERQAPPLLPAIHPVHPKPAQLPLSYAQERLWFLDQLEGSSHYHIPHLQVFTEELDREALEYALAQIVHRHEVLRTNIQSENGQAYQVLMPAASWKMAYTTIAHQEDLSALVETTIQKDFNLSQDHMMRAQLIKCDAHYLLVLVIHHIAADAWSMQILLQELMAFYQAKKEGRSADLPEMTVQYADYALWQAAHLNGEVLDRQLDYWEWRLKGAKPLNLPLDLPRPKVQSTQGRSINFTVDQKRKEALMALCKKEQVTPYMFLLSTFKVLLYRYTGQTDICVGSPIAGRTQQELEGLIGFFVNTLTLRSDLSENPSFRDLLAKVKTTTLAAYQHQDAPFEKIVERMVSERDSSRSPLFQVMFSYQSAGESQVMENLGLPIAQDAFSQELKNYGSYDIAKFDMTLAIIEQKEELLINLEYGSDLFFEERMLRLRDHFQEILSAVLAQPEQAIDDLKITTAERIS